MELMLDGLAMAPADVTWAPVPTAGRPSGMVTRADPSFGIFR